MAVELRSPDGLLHQDLYHHAAVATGSRTVFLAGQTATRPQGGIDVADLAGQVEVALHAIVTAVRDLGGGPADLTRLTAYVVGWSEDRIAPFEDGLRRAQRAEGLPEPLPPLTVIGVQALYRPSVLVEIEAIAVLD